MSVSEFDLIQHFFSAEKNRQDVILGVGDDCALLQIPPGMQLAVSMDTMVCGIHFPEQTTPFDIGYKLAAVNLSDLAAMGATPAWATLALTLPETDEQWLQDFSSGLYHLFSQYGVQLVGGDTTRGPLSVTLQIHGFVEQGKAITRGGAKQGDVIFVSGSLGDAAMALDHVLGNRQLPALIADPLLQRFNRPTPRVNLGLALQGIATSMIDISDGLLADLSHILQRSGVGAHLDIRKLPLSDPFKAVSDLSDSWELAAKGGDDYELCFTISAENRDLMDSVSQQCGCALHSVGEITHQKEGLTLLLPSGEKIAVQAEGYQHFV